METVQQPMAGFLDALASSAPTPGGGGAAALMGATGAALLSMVANLTIGKKGLEDVDAEMRTILAQAEALRAQLTAMIEDDVVAFNALMATYRLPKDSDEQKAARSAAIQQGLRGATEAPMACARAAAAVVRLSRRSAEIGNRNVISDTGVGVLAAQAALRSAALNVYINAPQLKDRVFADGIVQELEGLLAECSSASEDVYRLVVHRLGA
jgi:formiminotetrahydrofolate cyclodeaminase